MITFHNKSLKLLILSDNFDKVIESHKTIDILINNAGIAGETKPELVIDINLVKINQFLSFTINSTYYESTRTCPSLQFLESRRYGKLHADRSHRKTQRRKRWCDRKRRIDFGPCERQSTRLLCHEARSRQFHSYFAGRAMKSPE